jgi:spore coat polysaccharide biosynthesis protein SpsF
MVSRQKKIKEIILIVQARMGSTRLPGKMLLDLCGKPLVQRVLERVRNSKLVDKFILAVPDTKENDKLADFADENNFYLFKGSEEDVLDRFYRAVTSFNNPDADSLIVRVCADNPFVDPGEIDRAIDFFTHNNFDYVFNNIPALGNNYPNGLGAEVFGFGILKKVWEKAKSPSHREHVTKYIWDNEKEFNIGTLKAPSSIAYPKIRIDIDTQQDLEKVRLIYERLIKKSKDRIFSAAEIIDEIKSILD